LSLHTQVPYMHGWVYLKHTQISLVAFFLFHTHTVLYKDVYIVCFVFHDSRALLKTNIKNKKNIVCIMFLTEKTQLPTMLDKLLLLQQHPLIYRRLGFTCSCQTLYLEKP
ncbi:hypothetical protein ACJX0J_041783, partial [Zea mays]